MLVRSVRSLLPAAFQAHRVRLLGLVPVAVAGKVFLCPTGGNSQPPGQVCEGKACYMEQHAGEWPTSGMGSEAASPCEQSVWLHSDVTLPGDRAGSILQRFWGCKI